MPGGPGARQRGRPAGRVLPPWRPGQPGHMRHAGLVAPLPWMSGWRLTILDRALEPLRPVPTMNVKDRMCLSQPTAA